MNVIFPHEEFIFPYIFNTWGIYRIIITFGEIIFPQERFQFPHKEFTLSREELKFPHEEYTLSHMRKLLFHRRDLLSTII